MNYAGHNIFLRLFAALMLAAILPLTGQAIAQSNRAQLLTPKAELRAALIISDSVLVTRNPQGELGGVLVDIANALATSLSVPLHMPYDNIIRYNQRIGKDEWDIALTPPTAGVERWHNNQSSHANFLVFALGSIKRMPQ